MQIGVIGPGTCDEATAQVAFEVGREIARRGAILVCGGLGGVMEHAARGARAEGGCTVGIIPGRAHDEANPHIDVVIVTAMGVGRNALVVQSSEAIIAVQGGFGTLSELGFALQLGIPVIGLGTWHLEPGRCGEVRVVEARTPQEAVELAMRAASDRLGR